MASIKDVAKRAGVGVGTVSRALNGSGYVAKKTKQKIDEAIAELDYTPNELARNLFRNRTGIIGVIIPDLGHPFFSGLVKHIEMELYKKGYKTMVCNTIGTSNRERDYLEMLDRNMVDGIITGAHSLEDEEYKRINKPIVAMDRDLGEKIPIVGSDHKKGGRLAAEELLACGCKNVVQVTGASLVHNRAYDRHLEFSKTMLEHGIKVTTVETAWNNFSYHYFYKIMEEFLEEYPKMDGVFTADIPAICCMNIARQKGILVPDDLKIIGYDGMNVTRMCYPQLTAIKQDVPQLASLCVETILKLIEGDKQDIPDYQKLDLTMQYGGSTRKI